MAFNTPTLKELIDRASNEFETRLIGVDAKLRRSNTSVLARINAAATHGLYGFLRYIAKQLFADTAEVEYLERQCNTWGLARKPAARATGLLTLSGSAGILIPAGTKFQRQDGTEFLSLNDITFTSLTLNVPVISLAGAEQGNTAAGTEVTLISPIAGVQSLATVEAAGIIGGSEVEADDALRSRLLARIQQPPHGGAKFDYVSWALEIEGVTRAWCYPMETGAGTVVVRFVLDNDPSGFIPNQTKVDQVQAHLDYLRPVTADVTVIAPAASPVDIEISGLAPSSDAVKAAVEAELAAMFARENEPGGTVLLSHIREAISIASGEINHVVDAPSTDVNHPISAIPTLGTVTFA